MLILKHFRYTDVGGGKALRADFNLDFATDSQIAAIRGIFRGMQEYDRGYDENHTPYKITDIMIRKVTDFEDDERRRSWGMRADKTIQVHISTEPQTDNSYVRMADEKYRSTLIGARGGYYTYNSKHNRKDLSAFDVRYGKRPYSEGY